MSEKPSLILNQRRLFRVRFFADSLRTFLQRTRTEAPQIDAQLELSKRR
jgi:hypothetical protein